MYCKNARPSFELDVRFSSWVLLDSFVSLLLTYLNLREGIMFFTYKYILEIFHTCAAAAAAVAVAAISLNPHEAFAR